MTDDLRSRTIRLAWEKTELRSALLPLVIASDFEDAVKDQKFKNPETGNMVTFNSLPDTEQAKIRQQWKEQKSAPKPEKEKQKPEKEKPEKKKQKPEKGSFLHKVLQKAKDVTKEQKAFFENEAHLAGSAVRRSLGTALKSKTKGIVKAIKHEVKEFKRAGGALKKLASGEKISHHEKKALKAVAVHALLTAGSMALTGGASHAIHAGATGLLRAFGGHLMEHALATSVGKSLLFAKVSAEADEDALMEDFIKKLGKQVSDADLSADDWAKVVNESNAGTQKE